MLRHQPIGRPFASGNCRCAERPKESGAFSEPSPSSSDQPHQCSRPVLIARDPERIHSSDVPHASFRSTPAATISGNAVSRLPAFGLDDPLGTAEGCFNICSKSLSVETRTKPGSTAYSRIRRSPTWASPFRSALSDSGNTSSNDGTSRGDRLSSNRSLILRRLWQHGTVSGNTARLLVTVSSGHLGTRSLL